ncbi:hypothetical protein CBR_g39512 [Chara braunii]|uniref:Uncharacterized protein n=1 Tax=Chara braunii TaxID=69332 RepID=A0A388LS21_CHABU|nr:hypothetical protein CBR_g39512 [Chara braunii]|eukprot:GBG85049.1 hypothetical protein CBR_g39512 [Chara braunii]
MRMNFPLEHETIQGRSLSFVRMAILGITLPVGMGQLYTGSKDRSVRVWDCTSGQCTGNVDTGGSVGALLSEGVWLFVGLPDEIRCWNMQTSSQHSLSGHKGQVHCLAVSSECLFSGAQDAVILVWKFNAGLGVFENVASFRGHEGQVVALQVAGERLYSGSVDNTIKVWDLKTGLCTQTLGGHKAAVLGLLCWQQYLLSCSLDGSIKVWGASSTGALELTFSHPEEDFATNTADREGALAMCGTMDTANRPVLLCSYNDNTVRLYDLPSFTERGALFSKEEVRALAVGPGGLIFTGDSCGVVKVWRWK